MANTEKALRKMIERNVSSGIRLLRGRVRRIFSSAAMGLRAGRPVSTLASDGREATGLGSRSSGSGAFIGSKLSDICYSTIKRRCRLQAARKPQPQNQANLLFQPKPP